MGEFAGEPVDRRNDRIAFGHGEGSARAEVILHIDYDQSLAIGPRPSAVAIVHFSSAGLPVRWPSD